MTETRLAVDANAFRRPGAGIARYLRNMLSCLVQFHPDVHLMLYSASRVDPELPVGNWSIRADSGIRGRMASIWLQQVCPKWLAEDRADVFWGQHVLPLRLRKSCRRLLTIHDMTSFVLPQTMSLGSRFASAAFLRRSARTADRVVTDSRSTARQAAKWLGLAADKLTVIYPGADDEFLKGNQPSEGAVLTRLGLTPGYILAVGTLEPRKGYGLLLDALDQLPEAPQLVVVGAQGWKCRSLVKRLRTMERRGRARYLGRLSDACLPVLYRGAKLTAVPSFYEGFGFPVLEAMACGSPVLCSWSSSLPEVGGTAACYFRPGNPRDLVSCLRVLLGDTTRLAEMSTLGRVRAANFSFARAAGQLVELLH